jgi:hypothetical protein
MPTLNATPAPATPSDVDLKGTDHDPWDRQLFLVLRRHTGLHDVIAAAGTARRQRRVMRFIDARWHAPTGLGPIAVARLAPRALRMLLQRFRERRRLSEPRSPRVVQLTFQVIDMVPEPFAFALKLVTLASQRIALAFRVLGTLAPVDLCGAAIRIGWLRRSRHAAVMPEFVAQYKTR